MRIKSVPALAVVALLAVMALPFAGCSDTATTANAAERVREASRKSVDADSVAFEMTIGMSGVAGIDIHVTAEGEYDLANRLMTMTMDVFGQETEAVSDGEAIYLRMGMLGDTWIKQEFDGPANPAMGGAGEDPTKVLEWLTEAGDDVEDLGKDEVRGESATHYRVTLDLRETAGKLDAELREQVEQAMEMLGQDSLVVDIWLNEDDLPVRLAYEMSFANSEMQALRDASMTFTLEYFDWGKPVTVTLPDPDDVQSLEDAFGAFLED